MKLGIWPYFFGKRIAKAKKERESQIIKKAITLSEKINLSEEEMTELSSLQLELDKIYEEKARGAFIRSRRKWLEQGEKCTKYFFNLEKRNFELSSMCKLKINNLICEDVKGISQYVADFYQKLYAADCENERDMDMFLEDMERNIKCVDESFKSVCDQKISLT